MKVKDIMATDLRTCAPGTNLAAAAELMLDGDCGFLPVIDNGKLAGVVTDRDMYIALATRNSLASGVYMRAGGRRSDCAGDDEGASSSASPG